MEFLRAGEALLRSSQPILPFLTPAVHRSRPPRTESARQLVRGQRMRTLTISRVCQQQESAPKPREEQDPTSSQPSASSSNSNLTKEFSELLDSVLSKDKTDARAPADEPTRPRTSSSRGFGAPRRSAPPPGQRSGGGAISELLDMFAKPSPSSNRSSQINRSASGPIDIAAMLDPNRNVARSTGPLPPSVPPPAPMKLNSSVGRTIQVDALRGIDVAKAFRALDIQCARNKVKRDFMMQRFHERPGLKRKRLKRERWRKRFKENFVATVKMVQGMKAQGW